MLIEYRNVRLFTDLLKIKGVWIMPEEDLKRISVVLNIMLLKQKKKLEYLELSVN